MGKVEEVLRGEWLSSLITDWMWREREGLAVAVSQLWCRHRPVHNYSGLRVEKENNPRVSSNLTHIS